MMCDLCCDNRFELIEKYKKELIEATNIETSPDEMAVLDNILFRFWQMGWLDKLELSSVQPERQWIPCSERMPEEKDAGILKKLGTNKRSDYVLATVEVKNERMTITACTYDGVWHWDKKYAFPTWKVIAWMPLPKPYRGGKNV